MSAILRNLFPSFLLFCVGISINSYSDDYDPNLKQVDSFSCDKNVCVQKKVKKLKSRKITIKEAPEATESTLTPVVDLTPFKNDSNDKIDESSTSSKNSNSSLSSIKKYFLNPDLGGVYIVGGVTKVFNYHLNGERFRKGTDASSPFPIESHGGTGFQLGIGFNKTFPYHLLLGLEAFYMEPKVSSLGSWAVPYSMNGTSAIDYMNMNTNAKLTRSFGVKVRIGGYFWRIAAYGIIGYSCNMMNELNYTVSGPASISESKNVVAHGFVYGFGAEMYLTEFLFFRVEYTQNQFSYNVIFNNIYQDTNSNINNVSTGGNWQTSNLMRIGIMSASVGLKFNI